MLTIGLPFYNNQDTLADAIRSVFAQSFHDWQLFLVDDGSTDASLSIARSVRDRRVQVVSDGRNLGLAARLNQIVDLADGCLTARMDADDLMHPKRLERQIAQLESDPSLDLVDTGLLSIDIMNRPTGQRCCHRISISNRGLIRGETPVHASVVARTDWYRSHRYNTSLQRAQDYELWVRAYANNSLNIERIPEPLYFVREAAPGTASRFRATHRAKRRILRMHGPQVVGRARTGLEISKSLCKQTAYSWANRLGMEKRLIATRNQRLDDTDFSHMRTTINTVLGTAVPGLPAD